MRLVAQMKGGFYAAPPAAIEARLSYLKPPTNQPFTILDPCAGEGGAIGQLAESLSCSAQGTYAIELDDSRADLLTKTLRNCHVLAPANFFGCRASLGSFSLIWLNPPFDHAYGGHRVETRFLLTATDWLMSRGVMAFVCPEEAVGEYSDALRHFSRFYENVSIIPFPESVRRFKEVIVLAHKRAKPLGEHVEPSWAPHGFVYHISSGTGPKVFRKVEPTENELQQLLAHSPLRSHLTAQDDLPLPSPPLALGMGHVALLLASGHLNGVVQPKGQSPHVVRGTSRKTEFVSEVTETEEPDGRMVKRTTISEKIDLIVRTVDLTGQIQSFMDQEAA